MMMKGSIGKVEVVIGVAAKNTTFRSELAADPVSALRVMGFDLSNGEVAAIIDVVRGTNNSPLGARLTAARESWQRLN